MCGIVGYCGRNEAKDFLLDALKSLEYRGYDSAGISCIGSDLQIETIKRAGPVAKLETSFNGRLSNSSVGIGHTRWATHGEPSDRNAHPHLSYDGRVAIAHNGIIENYIELRNLLISRGIEFKSQTDSEVIAHLIAMRMEKGESLFDATRRTAYELDGLSVILAMSSLEPRTVVGTRVGWAGSLILGRDNDQTVLASNIAAMPRSIGEFTHIDHCEAAIISPDGYTVRRLNGSNIAKTSVPRALGQTMVEKGEHLHFMRKEIEEQTGSLQGAMRGRIDFSTRTVNIREIAIDAERIAQSGRILLTGMGSSQFVALSGARWVEHIANIPAYSETSGELVDRDPILGPETTLIAITQSGETYDTLTTVEIARNLGCYTIALTANPQSQVSNIAHATVDISAGLEVAVAATKTVTASMLTLYLIALQLAKCRETLKPERLAAHIDDLAKLPSLVNRTLSLESDISALATSMFCNVENALYLGRADLFPIALEGALKMKEVAYIHAEGLTASEMKHGTNALIDADTPTIALVPTRADLRKKMISSINEVQSRAGKVLAFAQEGEHDIAHLADEFLGLPEAPEGLRPFSMLVALQLLAYHTSTARGIDPDRPRNLAKTVTVA